MALARIITRSEVCARELAADLLARGYAVEIVTPDAVPGTSADLELRVEENPGKQLIASVHTHDGPRSASFEFRHQLRAPIADFLRKTRETTEVVYLSGGPEPSDEPVELPAKAPQPEIKTVSAPAAILLDPGSDLISSHSRAADSHPSDSHPAELSLQEAAPLPSLQERQLSRPMETVAAAVIHFAKEAEAVPVPPPIAQAPVAQATIAQATTAQALIASSNASPVVVPSKLSQARKRPSRWAWRAALAFIGMVSVALVLGLGIRHSEKTSGPLSGEASAEKIEAPSSNGYPSAADSGDDPQRDAAAVSGQAAALPSSESSMQWGWDWDDAPKTSTVDNAENAVVKASIVDKATIDMNIDKTTPSGRHGNDLIAHDTVTYFVGRPHMPKAQTAKSLARDPASHKHSGGVVAANSVTYLNKPDPKTAK
jgi:hypothetical protein